MLTVLITVLLAATTRGATVHYDCPAAATAPRIDGKLDDPAWAAAPWTGDFVDIEGADRAAPAQRTRTKIAWDADCLYIGAELSEPHVWAIEHRRDEPLFRENAFEAFLDPGGDGLDYVELQISADNTVCDLRMDKPYRDRGRADTAWDIERLRSAVQVDGTPNQPDDRDDKWTIELSIPWVSLDLERPGAGDVWRANFSRVQHDTRVMDGRYEKIAGAPARYSTWSPQGAVNMHIPERWGALCFVPQAEKQP